PGSTLSRNAMPDFRSRAAFRLLGEGAEAGTEGRKRQAVKLLVTYMELRAAPAPPPLRQPEGALQLAPERLSYEAYLSLYRDIGGPYSWDQRLRMPAAALADILSRPTTVAFVLREAGRPVGLCEFDAAD